MWIGATNFGGGAFREVSIRTEQSPARNSCSRPSDAQKFKRILKASDESAETGSQSLKHHDDMLETYHNIHVWIDNIGYDTPTFSFSPFFTQHPWWIEYGPFDFQLC